MFKWLYTILQSFTSKPEYKPSTFMDIMGYNKAETVIKVSSFTCECKNCNTQWDNRPDGYRGDSNTLRLYERCSECLNITSIPTSDVTLHPDGKRIGIFIKNLRN